MVTSKKLLIASKAFAHEHRGQSWWHLWSTIACAVALLAVAMSNGPLSVRILASVTAGFVGVRLFIIYHDHQHGAILGNSFFANIIMSIYGILVLNPPTVWNRSHDHHHKHNSKGFGANIGSYPIMTTHAYAAATPAEQFAYRAARHPMSMLLGYLTVFMWGMCLRPFVLSPRRHFDGGLALLIHLGGLAYLSTWGWDVMFLGMMFPLWVATSLGAYLFYAQHNFPAAKLNGRSEWNHADAALQSSGYIAMGPVMSWLTGNIGYHHVHHLNAKIRFYRLPEAMASMVELQSPGTTSLRPHDIRACLRLKLWSPELDKFVGIHG